MCGLLILLATFQKGILIGIEKTAAVGRDIESLMLDAAVHHAECSQQTHKRIMPAFEQFFALPVRRFAEAFPEPQHAVVGLKEFIVRKQYSTLFGAEEKYQPHHERECRVVEALFIVSRKKFPVSVAVNAVHGLNQNLDGPA